MVRIVRRLTQSSEDMSAALQQFRRFKGKPAAAGGAASRSGLATSARAPAQITGAGGVASLLGGSNMFTTRR